VKVSRGADGAARPGMSPRAAGEFWGGGAVTRGRQWLRGHVFWGFRIMPFWFLMSSMEFCHLTCGALGGLYFEPTKKHFSFVVLETGFFCPYGISENCIFIIIL
jgi:hypothetical protein